MKIYAEFVMGCSVMFLTTIHVRGFKFLNCHFLFHLLTVSFPSYYSSEWIVYCRSFSFDLLLLYWRPIHMMIIGRGKSTFYNLPIKTPSFSGPVPLHCDLQECFSSGMKFFSPQPLYPHSCHSLDISPWSPNPFRLLSPSLMVQEGWRSFGGRDILLPPGINSIKVFSGRVGFPYEFF